MPSLNEFEDDTDREHCRLDPHKVWDGTMYVGEWWTKWAAKVETALALTPTDPDEIERINEQLREAQEDATDARRSLRDLTQAARGAIKELENAL